VAFSSRFFEKISVSKAILDADIYISLPKFKTHGLTMVTAAVKNSYGILPGGQKARGHRIAGNPVNFSELVVDVFGLRVPDLIIVDAVVGMEGNGPVSEDLRHIGRIMASDNAVALDATISRMMGVDPANLRFIQVAVERGYGDFKEEGIEIIGEFNTVPDFKLPPYVKPDAGGVLPAHREMMDRLAKMRPKADEALCSGCETCIDQCPVSALAMLDGIPFVDPDKCIICYCCQESCPERAIELC
jgi:NAD-dependent dihydropyrimidine dehydrogenase PreA subunit